MAAATIAHNMTLELGQCDNDNGNLYIKPVQ